MKESLSVCFHLCLKIQMGGGIRKEEKSIQFLTDMHDNFPGTWILWVRCSGSGVPVELSWVTGLVFSDIFFAETWYWHTTVASARPLKSDGIPWSPTNLPHLQFYCALHLIALRCGNWATNQRQQNETHECFSGFISLTACLTHKANHSDDSCLVATCFSRWAQASSWSEHPQSSGVLKFGGFVQPIKAIGERDKMCVQFRTSPVFSAVWTGGEKGS